MHGIYIVRHKFANTPDFVLLLLRICNTRGRLGGKCDQFYTKFKQFGHKQNLFIKIQSLIYQKRVIRLPIYLRAENTKRLNEVRHDKRGIFYT